MAFTYLSTTDDVLAGLDLSHKVAVITGASGGIGAETARALASRGATVLMLARDAEKLANKVAELRQTTANERIHFLAMDLADLNSVRATATKILNDFPAIHMLINNAGIMACPLARTAQGFEMQIGVNHIGHFLLTTLLIPALKAAAPARIVMLSSGAHKLSAVDLDDLNWQQREYDKWTAYGASKTANALCAVELQRRLAPFQVTANAVHPGVIMTDLGRHLTPEDYAFMATDGLIMKSPAVGAATTVWAAASPDLQGQGGLYLEDCHVSVPLGKNHPLSGFMQHAVDPDTASALWEKTEQMIAACA